MLSTMIIMIFLFIPLCLNGQTRNKFFRTWTLNAIKYIRYGAGWPGTTGLWVPGGGFGSGNLVVNRSNNLKLKEPG